MKKIGLTGGIGSGKSYVAKIFEALGVPVFYADNEAKKIIDQPDILEQLSVLFSANMVDENGKTNKSLIAEIIFNDAGKRAQMSALIHPAVEQAFNNWSLKYQALPYVIKEAAILFESGTYKNLDAIITVTAPEALRLVRCIARDKQEPAVIKKRMEAQWSDAEKIKRSNFVVVNDNYKPLLAQVLDIHQALL